MGIHGCPSSEAYQRRMPLHIKGVLGVKYHMGCDHSTKVYKGPGTAPPGPEPEFVAGAMAPPKPRPRISFGALAPPVPGSKNFTRASAAPTIMEAGLMSLLKWFTIHIEGLRFVVKLLNQILDLDGFSLLVTYLRTFLIALLLLSAKTIIFRIHEP